LSTFAIFASRFSLRAVAQRASAMQAAQWGDMAI
jgi:hypothetical protein